MINTLNGIYNIRFVLKIINSLTQDSTAAIIQVCVVRENYEVLLRTYFHTDSEKKKVNLADESKKASEILNFRAFLRGADRI